jgi:hypothetical protein
MSPKEYAQQQNAREIYSAQVEGREPVLMSEDEAAWILADERPWWWEMYQ